MPGILKQLTDLYIWSYEEHRKSQKNYMKLIGTLSVHPMFIFRMAFSGTQFGSLT